jgi:glutamine synthetase type III
MQVSIDVQDDLYKKIVTSGIDMQSKFNEYLRDQFEEDTYLHSAEFQADKQKLEKTLEEIKNGTAKLLSHEEMWQKIENFSRNR